MRVRGEFKTPGGKLISVEFDVQDATLWDVVVTGDFFLYPEDALPRLSRSLEGSSTTLRASDYAELVRSALAGDVELLGSSPEALATAVIRALDASESTGATDGN